MPLLTTDSAKLHIEHTHARLASNLVRLAEIEMDRALTQEAATRLEAEMQAEAAAFMNTVRTEAQASLAEAIAQPVGTENMEDAEPGATIVESEKEGPEHKAPSVAGSAEEPHTKRRHTGQLPEDDDLMPDDQMGMGAANAAVVAQEVPTYHSEPPTATPFVDLAPTHSVGTENSTEPHHFAMQQLIEKKQVIMQQSIENSMAPMLAMLLALKSDSVKKDDLKTF